MGDSASIRTEGRGVIWRRGVVRLAGGALVQWLRLGSGPVPIVVVPSASDGLLTTHQYPWRLIWRYRRRLRSCRLLKLSLRQSIPAGHSTDQHADDLICVVEEIDWGPSIWECTSAGGPIGQAVAVKRPDLVCGLILASTSHRANERVHSVLRHWRRLAEERRWPALYWSLLKLGSWPRRVGLIRFIRPLFPMLPAPTDSLRFVRIMEGIESVDNTAILPRVSCPTLVIGGCEDACIPEQLQREMAALIPRSATVLYPGHGHVAPMEHPDAERTMLRFARQVWAASRSLPGSSVETGATRDNPGQASIRVDE
jgi:pimeloyl-ACP methyl ester carboxylesterase